MKRLSFLFAFLILTGASCSFVSAPQEVACGYNGERYEMGQQFPAEDGCNTCTCGINGQIECTEEACVKPPAIQTCQTAADCENVDIDTSFCDGAWACIERQCEYTCDFS